MDFIDLLKKLAETVKSKKNLVQTEEATKMTFIMPFLQALGYNVFDPSIVVPEYTADIGIKKGEKVDYAIMKDNKPFIIIEAKNHTEDLDNHNNQLIRYFNTSTDIKFAILTNGLEYRFFTDIEEQNVLDESPFLVVDLENLNPEKDSKALMQFMSSKLDLEKILNSAIEKKYVMGIRKEFERQLKEPDDDFVIFFAKKLTNKRMTANVIDDFRTYVVRSLEEYIDDKIFDEISGIQNKFQQAQKEKQEAIEAMQKDEKEIITTEEEMQGFYIVKSVLSSCNISLDKIDFKDTLSYFGILYEGKVTKWICRLYLNNNKKYIAFPNDDGSETKELISNIEDIYKHKDLIIKSFNFRAN